MDHGCQRLGATGIARETTLLPRRPPPVPGPAGGLDPRARPVPWLIFDPVTGTLTSTPPAGGDPGHELLQEAVDVDAECGATGLARVVETVGVPDGPSARRALDVDLEVDGEGGDEGGVDGDGDGERVVQAAPAEPGGGRLVGFDVVVGHIGQEHAGQRAALTAILPESNT